MNILIENINNLEDISKKIYDLFTYAIYKLPKQECIENLTKIENGLKLISHEIYETIRKTNIQYARELNIPKLKLFSEEFLSIASKINRQIVLEKNTKEIDSDLIKIKEEITKPEQYFNIEEDIKNKINLFQDYLEQIKNNLKYKYQDINTQKKSTEELLKILDQKDEKIIELNKKIDKLHIIESKEEAKSSKLSELEEQLLKRSKASEQDLTILKLHVVNIERELDSLYRHIKNLNNDIKHLEAKDIEKEQISLELIKELKDELLATRYLLSKK
jgi:chromosome segregation ATPase